MTTTKEAGRMGAAKIMSKYGPDYYKTLSKQGGTSLRNKLGEGAHDYYSRLGKISALRRKQRKDVVDSNTPS